jgi:hypothetical protein
MLLPVLLLLLLLSSGVLSGVVNSVTLNALAALNTDAARMPAAGAAPETSAAARTWVLHSRRKHFRTVNQKQQRSAA